jgi:hypothetical protein
MSKMKALTIAALGMSLLSMGQQPKSRVDVNIPDVSEDTVHELNGLTKFWYGDNYLYALNKKSADKKAKKKGWL